MRSCGWYYEPRLRKEDTNDQVDDSVVDAGRWHGNCNDSNREAGGLAVIIVSGSNLVRRPHCQQQMGTGICCTNTAQKYVHVRATTQHPHAQNKHERPLLEAQQKEPQARVRAWGSRSHYSTTNLVS